MTVLFPSPAGVGLIPVTSTSRPVGFRRATASGLILALYRPYGRMSSGAEADLGGDVGDRPQLGRLRDGDVGRDGGHGGGCHGDSEARCDDRPKTRAAFWPVTAISSSTGIPRTAAIRSATWRTKAGSLRLPRCGTGAR